MSFIPLNQEMLLMLDDIPADRKTVGAADNLVSSVGAGRNFDPSSSHRAMVYCHAEGGDTGYYIRDTESFVGLNLRVRNLNPKLSSGTFWSRGFYELLAGS